MASYEDLMNAARKAHSAGEADHAKRLVQMAGDVKGQGTGAFERAGELAGGVASGAARGATQLLGLPGTISDFVDESLVSGINAAFGFDLQKPKGSILSGGSLQQSLSDVTGGLSEYRAPGTAGEFAGTVGEFLPGAALGGAGVIGKAKNLAQFGIVPGVASEAAGQATEGTSLEPYARLAGAVLSPIALKAPSLFLGGSKTTPNIENLKATKTAAYKAADDANVMFTSDDIDDLVGAARKAMDDADFVVGVDTQTAAAMEILKRNSGKEMSLGQLDKLRQGLYRRYNSDKTQVAILDMIDAIDGKIQSNPIASPAMDAARLANSRFKKSELLNDAFTKATDQAASTGSGGNIANKYRQAVTSIINNPKKARWFTQPEITAMRDFVRPGKIEGVLRLGGKLSPGGNGLMAALNLGAVSVNPAMLGVTAAAIGSKAAADQLATGGAQKIQQLLATGVKAPPLKPDIGLLGGATSGLLAQ
jgi:hypothetical protein